MNLSHKPGNLVETENGTVGAEKSATSTSLNEAESITKQKEPTQKEAKNLILVGKLELTR